MSGALQSVSAGGSRQNAEAVSISDARRRRQPGSHPVAEMRRQARAGLNAEQLSQIEPLLDEAEKHSPDSGICLHYVGKVHQKLHNSALALRTFQDALQAGAQSAALFNDMGNTLAGMKQLSAAERAYGIAIKLRPDLVQLYGSLGNVMLAQGKRDETIAMYERCAEINPDSALAKHMLSALRGFGGAERAPDEYLRETFDAFASSFDEKLASLRYNAPEIVAAIATRGLGAADGLSILDAGCGTGLCAPHLKPRARRLTGIDISAGMLAKAAARGAYDALIEGELTETLGRFDSAFDLVVAADVLVYFGALEPLMARLCAALRPGGAFICTIEAAPAEDAEYRLGPAGRYSHAPAYLERAANAAGLQTEIVDRCVLRYEYGEPVIGIAAMFKKNLV